MKKTLAILLLLATLLSLVSCQTLSENPTATESETETTPPSQNSSETVPMTFPEVPTLMSWDRINALPIGNDSMTEDEKRQLVVDFFRLQQTFQWTPNEDLTYIITTYATKNSFPVGGVYEGLPYENGRGNLYSAMEYYDPETGVLDVARVGGANFPKLIGNHCSYGVFWAWARISNTLDFTLTVTMTPYNGCVPLGGYDVRTDLPKWTNDYNTRVVCNENGEQKMFRAYAQMKLGDGMVFCNNSGGGHVQMVSGVPCVVYNNDGTINGKESYLLYMDQGSAQNDIVLANGQPGKRQGEIDTKYTFAEMFKSGYIPFTIAEIIGQDPIEKAVVTLDSENPISTLTDLTNATINSNYAISHTYIYIYDTEGNEVYHYMSIPSSLNSKTVKGNAIFVKTTVSRLLKDGYRLKLTCFVGTGEEFTLLDNTLTV